MNNNLQLSNTTHCLTWIPHTPLHPVQRRLSTLSVVATLQLRRTVGSQSEFPEGLGPEAETYTLSGHFPSGTAVVFQCSFASKRDNWKKNFFNKKRNWNCIQKTCQGGFCDNSDIRRICQYMSVCTRKLAKDQSIKGICTIIWASTVLVGIITFCKLFQN